MEIDLPEVVAEVTAEFERYEKALVSNDVATLGRDISQRSAHHPLRRRREFFTAMPRSRRSAPRARRPALRARCRRPSSAPTAATHAVASTLFHRPTMPGKIGRQMQTWVRFPEGWRVVAAHVSVIDETEYYLPRVSAPSGKPVAA